MHVTSYKFFKLYAKTYILIQYLNQFCIEPSPILSLNRLITKIKDDD
jgi:hypothetical protein